MLERKQLDIAGFSQGLPSFIVYSAIILTHQALTTQTVQVNSHVDKKYLFL